MFQTGYLTIVGYNHNSHLYKLDYPNQEVRSTFQKYLLEVFAQIEERKYYQQFISEKNQLFCSNYHSTANHVNLM